MSQKETLAQAIHALQEQMLPTLPEATLNVLLGSIQQQVDSGQAETALNQGDRCPDFSLPAANGEMVSVSEKLKSGPLVISFYRGAWCPYCNLEIRALATHIDQIRQLGADLVAISPQVVDKSDQQSRSLDLSFDVLSDVGNKVAREFGLCFSLSDEVRPVYDAFEFDLPGHNGDENYELPIPATYIIDRQGSIRHAFVDADYTRRMEPSDIIEQLRQL